MITSHLCLLENTRANSTFPHVRTSTSQQKESGQSDVGATELYVLCMCSVYDRHLLQYIQYIQYVPFSYCTRYLLVLVFLSLSATSTSSTIKNLCELFRRNINCTYHTRHTHHYSRKHNRNLTSRIVVLITTARNKEKDITA